MVFLNNFWTKVRKFYNQKKCTWYGYKKRIVWFHGHNTFSMHSILVYRAYKIQQSKINQQSNNWTKNKNSNKWQSFIKAGNPSFFKWRVDLSDRQRWQRRNKFKKSSTSTIQPYCLNLCSLIYILNNSNFNFFNMFILRAKNEVRFLLN